MSVSTDRGKVLRKTWFYPHPPEVVWTALTDPRALAEWLMPNNFAPVVGRKFTFQTDPVPGFSGRTECEVLECDRPHRLAYSWVIVPRKAGAARHAPTVVSWTLAPHEGGTRVVFEHRSIENIHLLHRVQMAFGWKTMHSAWLPRVMARVRLAPGVEPRFEPGAIPLNKRCYKASSIDKDMIF